MKTGGNRRRAWDFDARSKKDDAFLPSNLKESAQHGEVEMTIKVRELTMTEMTTERGNDRLMDADIEQARQPIGEAELIS